MSHLNGSIAVTVLKERAKKELVPDAKGEDEVDVVVALIDPR